MLRGASLEALLPVVEHLARRLDEATATDVSTLTDTQDKALSLLPLLSGVLSVWGSSNIIYLFFSSDKNKRDCYKRIMLGLSVSDFMSSIILSLQPFLLPAQTSHRAWASGTDATCAAMGFFQQLAFSAIWYNGMLSFMFLLKIKYSVEEEVLERRYEPWMHLLSIGVPLVSAIVGAAMGMYAELIVGHFCWFTGDDTTIFAFIVAGAPTLFFIFAIPINNWLVYRHVRHSIHQQKRYPRPIAPNDSSNNSNTSADNNDDDDSKHNMSTGGSPGANSTFSNEEIREQQRDEARRQSEQARQQERMQSIAFQAFLYVASFLITHLPTFILRATSAIVKVEPSDEGQFFPLLLIQAILLPLQGLFNYLIFSRPMPYLRETLG